MYNLHTRKFHFQRNVRGHLSSNFQVTWANSTNSTDRRRGAPSTATVKTRRSTADTVLQTTEKTQEPENPVRRTQRTRTKRLKEIEDNKKKWITSKEQFVLAGIDFKERRHWEICDWKKFGNIKGLRWYCIFLALFYLVISWLGIIRRKNCI